VVEDIADRGVMDAGTASRRIRMGAAMENRSSRGLVLALSSAFLLITQWQGGCAGGSGSPGYVDDYEHGRYSQASVDAIRVVRDSAAPDRDSARLTAGLSAHAMGRNDEATVWLRPLTTNRNDEVAGKALATLGLIAMADGELRTAAMSLSRAAGKLKGDDSAQAAMRAGDAYASMGSIDAARLQYRLAEASARDTSIKGEIASRLGEGYTLQVGAFAKRANADRSRRMLARDPQIESLGDPVILQRADGRGRTLYIVQVGRFQTRHDARAAKLRLGVGGIVTIAGSEHGSG